jgi:putative transposase
VPGGVALVERHALAMPPTASELRRPQPLSMVEGVPASSTHRAAAVNRHAAAAPDLVRCDFRATRPDQLWVADITDVRTWQGWLYVAVVVDTYSRRVEDWSMRDDLQAELVVDALEMAVWRRQPPAGLVHHSDRGSQYTSWAIGRSLRDCGILQSMGSRGDAYDNAQAESFMSTLKTELIDRRSWPTRDDARRAIFDYIEGWYNPHRRHSALGYKAPPNTRRSPPRPAMPPNQTRPPKRVNPNPP